MAEAEGSRPGRRWRWIAACVVFLAGVATAHAQEVYRSQPVLLNAEELTYDETLGIVTARGNVELSQGERVLRADSVSYNQKDNTVSASGNITLLEPTGEVLFAEYAELTKDMREGFMQGLRMLLSDDSRFAAVNARRLGGVETQLSKAVYSPCIDCVDSDGNPIWQIKARKVTHNSESKEVVYRDAHMEMFGVPVMYTPYFSHPDPSVKRKSGFLAPTFGVSQTLGPTIRVPYFWAIDESSDITFDPIVSSDAGVILTGEYRRAFASGELRSRVSGTRDDYQTGERRTRGHIDADARFNIDEIWRWGSDLRVASDDTYLARYGFPTYDNTLTSQIFAEGFTRRSFARGDIMYFQGLSAEDNQDDIPIAAPNIVYNFVGEPDKHGAFWTMDANAVALTRTGNATTDSRRVAVETGWELPHIGSRGDVTTFKATLQTDLYQVANVADPGSSATLSGITGRVFPKLSVNWRYPWVRNTGRSSEIIEPIVTLVAAPNGSNPDEIPNEDSLAFEFDENNLFERSRFVGTDRVDGGAWAAYGLRIGAYGAGGGGTTILFGQSYRIRSDDVYPPNSGLEKNFSDFVGRLSISPNKYVDLLYKARLDKKDFSARRTEIAADVGPRAFSVGVNYVFFDSTDEFPDREEVLLRASSAITDSWAIAADTRRDLTSGGGTISYGASVTYTCDCMDFTIDYRRTFTRDRDIKPDESIIIRLGLKNLGELESAVY